MTATADCRQTGLRLTPFIAGELEVSDHAVLELHLEGCPSCRDELARTRELDRLLSQSRPLPADVRERLERFADALDGASLSGGRDGIAHG